MNSNYNMLFYSRKCNTCTNLINILQNESLICYFKPICVDDDIKQWSTVITMVPAMILTDCPRPIVAKECFMWIEKAKFFRQQQQLDNIKNKMIQQAMIQKQEREQGGPARYSKIEMEGISDECAILNENVNISFPKTFVGVKDENVIFTAPEAGKVSTEEQRRKAKKLEQDREAQDKSNFEIQKREQIAAVHETERESHSLGSYFL